MPPRNRSLMRRSIRRTAEARVVVHGHDQDLWRSLIERGSATGSDVALWYARDGAGGGAASSRNRGAQRAEFSRWLDTRTASSFSARISARRWVCWRQRALLSIAETDRRRDCCDGAGRSVGMEKDMHKVCPLAGAGHDGADSEVDNFRLIGMMQTAMSATLDRTDAKPVTRRSVFIFRFASTVVLWSVALLIIFSGYELRVLRIDQRGRSDRALGILRDARLQGAAELQDHRHDLRGRDALRQFLLFQQKSGRRAPTTSNWQSCSFSS